MAEQERQLYSTKLLSRLELDRADSNARQLAAEEDAALASTVKAGKQDQRNPEERLANIQNLQRQASAFEADRETLVAQIERLKHELGRRRVYAPVSGTLAEVETVKPGMFVRAGQKVATILPSGGLKAVAQFLPEAVAGRVRPGQPARLLVDRFSWSQYGAVPLTVQTVGTDVQNARIKVELLVNPSFHSNIPIQHGLRGAAKVLAERAITPGDRIANGRPVSGRTARIADGGFICSTIDPATRPAGAALFPESYRHPPWIAAQHASAAC